MSGVARFTLRSVSWLVLVVVVSATLAIGVMTGREDITPGDRAASIGRNVQCPVCDGQSVVESNTPVAVNIRSEIERRVREGWTDAEIYRVLSDTYGERVILNPSGDGLTGLVWIVPVAALAVAAGGLGLTFARWRVRRGDRAVGPSDADRRLVDQARRSTSTSPGRR